LPIVTKSIEHRAAASTAGADLNKRVIIIGDSLVSAGITTQTLLDIAATDVMGITLQGTRGSALNKHEGRGGWTVDNYTTAGPTFHAFTVSGVTISPVIASVYTNNGGTFTVQEIALTGGAGTITCSFTGAAPAASGTLTKLSGAGGSTIAFSSSSAQPGNPFWIAGALNFTQYLTNNAIATPDWVLVGLGINDIFSSSSDASAVALSDAALVKMDTLIASIKAAGASVKVGLMIPTPCSESQDAFGENYGVGQSTWRFKRNILTWAKQMIAKYSAQEANRIYLVPSNTALDTVNNMMFATDAPVNSRSTITVARQNNGVHPATSGYQQISDAVWAFLKFYA
jgi:lysophospholipase L1-like esterase